MGRSRHSNKAIEAALRQMEAEGWVFRDAHGHARFVGHCPAADVCACRVSVWSTPRNPENHARQLLRMLRRCSESR